MNALGRSNRPSPYARFRPNEWSQEYLADRGTSQREQLARMQQQGAPMVA